MFFGSSGSHRYRFGRLKRAINEFVIDGIGFAGIMALILMPLVHLLERHLRFSRLAAVITIFGAFLVVGTGFAVAVIPPAVSQLLDFITFLPTLWERAVLYR